MVRRKKKRDWRHTIILLLYSTVLLLGLWEPPGNGPDSPRKAALTDTEKPGRRLQVRSSCWTLPSLTFAQPPSEMAVYLLRNDTRRGNPGTLFETTGEDDKDLGPSHGSTSGVGGRD